MWSRSRHLTHIRNRFRLAFGVCQCCQVIYSVYQNAISPGYSIIEMIPRYPEESRLATQPKRNCIFNDFPFWDFERTVYLSAMYELISHGFLGKWKRQMIYSVYRRYVNRANKRPCAIGAHNVSIYHAIPGN